MASFKKRRLRGITTHRAALSASQGLLGVHITHKMGLDGVSIGCGCVVQAFADMSTFLPIKLAFSSLTESATVHTAHTHRFKTWCSLAPELRTLTSGSFGASFLKDVCTAMTVFLASALEQGEQMRGTLSQVHRDMSKLR